MPDAANPFHVGELKAQARAGKTDVSDWAAGFIRPYMPDQHRDFFQQLPFLVLAGADARGRAWVTLIDGPDGFVASPDATTLSINTTVDEQDPLFAAFTDGADVGLLGIELANRRRNRMTGHLRQTGAGFAIKVSQSFGNCPQYIHERAWRRVRAKAEPEATRSHQLSPEQITRIQSADTVFVGTGYQGRVGHASNGFDASHRGGAAGFVQASDPAHLRIPDYAGNNFFNTIGNLLENPAIGLVFVDFETGGLLHVSGHASVDWEPQDSHDPNAMRMINVTLEEVLDRPAAVSLRWSVVTDDLRPFVVSGKVRETPDITSFYLTSPDGQPVPPFAPGQHLPVELDIPGQSEATARSYSLSGAPGADMYRLTIKRERHGLATCHLHDTVEIGDHIRARSPSGDFAIPCSNCPLVLVSAGVGVTPMIAVLHASVANPDRPVWFVHGARNSSHHALRSEVESLVKDRPHIQTRIFYSQPGSDETLGRDFDAVGRMSAGRLVSLSQHPETHYMLCGPARFLADMLTGLEKAGVPDDHVHFEVFGPTG